MPIRRRCPLCEERVENLTTHLGTPEGEGCAKTPMVTAEE